MEEWIEVEIYARDYYAPFRCREWTYKKKIPKRPAFTQGGLEYYKMDRFNYLVLTRGPNGEYRDGSFDPPLMPH